MPLLVAGLLAQASTTTTTTGNVQSKNPILPSTPEIVWGAIWFAILFLVMWKFAYPSISKLMKTRTETIRGNIDEADRVRAEAETILAEYQSQLADARNEANRIIEEARLAAEQVRTELIRRADEEVSELRRRNTEDLVAAQERIVNQLQSQVRTLAIDLAERVVGANLDREQNLRLVDQFVAELNSLSLRRHRRTIAGSPMSDATDAYAQALFEIAKAEGSLETVEDELFKVARTLEANEDLRATLLDAAIPIERRVVVVESLLGGRVSPITSALVAFVVAAGRSKNLPEIIDKLVARAAEERHEAVAEVRTAYPIDDDHIQALADALGRATGKHVSVKVIVDPSIMGGVVARIGDTVIDGSVRHRIEQLRESLSLYRPL